MEQQLFDLGQAKSRAEALARNRKIRSVRTLVLPLVAHVASIATLLGLWFMRGGSFKFSPGSWTDWTVVTLLVLALASGLRLVLAELRRPSRLTVNRSELTDLVAVSRAEAELSVVNLGGDLSWLPSDLPALRSIKISRPDLRVRVFYHRSRVPREMSPILAEAEGLGIDFVPYPEGVDPSIRCMLIDREIPDNVRLHVYRRLETPLVGQPPSRQPFIWEEFGQNSEFIISAMSAFVDALESMKPAPIKIGISGLNNVGKTTLATRLRDLISKKYSVRLVGDQFRIAGGGTSLRDNYIILLSQLMSEVENGAEVCVFDRTSIDNLCFLRARTGADDIVYQTLAPRIAVAAERYDMIFFVERSNDGYSTPTRCLTGEERLIVHRTMSEFFTTYDIPRIGIKVDPGRFEESIEEAANRMCSNVFDLARTRRLNP